MSYNRSRYFAICTIFDVHYYFYRDYQFVDMITKINPEIEVPLIDTQLKVDLNKLNKLTPVKKIEEENKNKRD